MAQSTTRSRTSRSGSSFEGDLEELDEAATERIDEAVEFAEDSDFPPPESIYDHVYVLGGR